MPGGGEVFAKEGMGNLRQDASAIASTGIRADASAMSEIDQPGQCAIDDLARRPTGNVDDETDPTGIVLERWIPEGCAGVGEAGRCLHDLVSPAGIHVHDPSALWSSLGRPRGRTAPPPGTNSGLTLQRGIRG